MKWDWHEWHTNTEEPKGIHGIQLAIYVLECAVADVNLDMSRMEQRGKIGIFAARLGHKTKHVRKSKKNSTANHSGNFVVCSVKREMAAKNVTKMDNVFVKKSALKKWICFNYFPQKERLNFQGKFISKKEDFFEFFKA